MSRVPEQMPHYVFVLRIHSILSPRQILNPKKKNRLSPPQNLEEVSFQLRSRWIMSCPELNLLCLRPTNGDFFTGDSGFDLSDALDPGKPISPLSSQGQ